MGTFLGWALIVATALYFGGHIIVYMFR